MKKLFAISLMLAIFLPDCTKEKISPTTSDQVAMQLQKVIKERGIDRVYAIDISSGFQTPFPSNAGAFWTFSNGFIEIQGYGLNQSRNLNHLAKYNVGHVTLDTGGSVLALLLYFD